MTVVNEQLARLKARYQASPLPGFLSWWRDELLSVLPEHWRSRLWPPRERLYLTAENQRVYLWRASGDQVLSEHELVLDVEHEEELSLIHI